MQWLWLVYWGLFLFSFIFGIIAAIKKNKITGTLQTILSLILPIWALAFALKRDYLSSGAELNEIHFMYTKIISGDIEAILIMLSYIILIIIFFYNLSLFKKVKIN